MKQFLFLMLFFISMPAFAVPGYQEKMDSIGGKPLMYDISKEQAYFEKLEKEFFERHPNGFSGAQYDKEVRIPAWEYTFKVQKERGTGYKKF